MKRTLKNILCASAFVAAANLLPSCEKEDTTPPKITISSPLNGKIYNERIIPVQWYIEDKNGDFRSSWGSDNDKEKLQLYSKSGSINWYFVSGYHKLVIGADNLSSKIGKDSVYFYINDVIK